MPESEITSRATTVPASRGEAITLRAGDSSQAARRPMIFTGCGIQRGSPSSRSSTTAIRIWYFRSIIAPSVDKYR